jgi:phytoene dehydrogenase-like protein
MSARIPAQRTAAPTAGQRDRQHDMIVIGAGHNGLVAANYLADEGLDVLVVEASDTIGGMTSSAYAIPEAPQHLINHCAVDPIMWTPSPPARDFHLDQHGLRLARLDPAFAYLHPDGASIAFWSDPAKTAAEIRRFAVRDATAFLEFARFLDSFWDLIYPLMNTNPVRPSAPTVARLLREALRHRRDVAPMFQFALASGKEAIAERFEHPVVRSALHVACGATMPSSLPGSTLQFLLLAGVHRVACLRPVGGTQALPNTLAARLQSLGGRILTGAAVRQIQVQSGRAVGVELADGTQIRARRGVVTSCDPQQTLLKLLPDGILAQKMANRARAIPANGSGWGQMKIDIACDSRIDLSRHQKQRTDDLDLRLPSHWIGTEDGIERAYAASAAGQMPDPEDIVFYNAVPTAIDPSQAPAGQDALYLLAVAVPFAPPEGWKTIKNAAAARVIARAGEFYQGLADMEIGRQVHTHQDIAELKHVTNGCHPHVDQVLSRVGPLRPALGLGGYRTSSIQGLHFAGSGSQPGGAVTGLPGYLGAQAAIRDMKHETAQRVKGHPCSRAASGAR